MDLKVTPWKRYGHERSYVGVEGQPSLGFLDHKTGEVHVDSEEDRPRVLGALGLAEPAPLAASLPALEYAVTVDRLATDLGHNRAGATTKAKAQQLREAAPVRTRLARVLGVHTEERAWRVGGQGEEIVGEELEKLLRRGWSIVHNVPVGERGSDIDHVLIGPGGVFTVNSKYHVGKTVWVGGDTVVVGGHRQPYVRNARHEAQRAAKLLSSAAAEPVAVTGLVIILTWPAHWTAKSQPKDGSVLVLRARAARKHLESLPAVLEAGQVERLAYLARRDLTWRP